MHGEAVLGVSSTKGARDFSASACDSTASVPETKGHSALGEAVECFLVSSQSWGRIARFEAISRGATRRRKIFAATMR